MGLIEECVGVDGDILNQVLIPLMNIDRRCLDGSVHEEEALNKSQIFVNNSDTIERSIEEKPAELLGSPERVISSEASSKEERSTTISGESTQQAIGCGSGGRPYGTKIQSDLHRNMQQRKRIRRSEPYGTQMYNRWL